MFSCRHRHHEVPGRDAICCAHPAPPIALSTTFQDCLRYPRPSALNMRLYSKMDWGGILNRHSIHLIDVVLASNSIYVPHTGRHNLKRNESACVIRNREVQFDKLYNGHVTFLGSLRNPLAASPGRGQGALGTYRYRFQLRANAANT